MEAIVVLVGFLGAGKTSLLAQMVERSLADGWDPFVILNDYENAQLEAQQLGSTTGARAVTPLTGSCICCDGIEELRTSVNRIPERERGLTLIEANGTSDACRLMEFLGVGLDARFKPPVQISVVDAKNWQRRPAVLTLTGGDHNELERSQVQISSLIVLTHLDEVTEGRRREVEAELRDLNPYARVTTREDLDISLLPGLTPGAHPATALEHQTTHWASCSVDLPGVPHLPSLQAICDLIPASVVRIKGCTRVGGVDGWVYFERTPDGEVFVRPYRGTPITGPKLLAIGPGSDPGVLMSAVERGIARDPTASMT
jgi:G3E family GTPase